MSSKKDRLRIIAKILNSQVITSQEQLTQALVMQGIKVTQATLSRDLHDLRAEKKMLPDGVFKYVIPANPVVEKRVLGVDSQLTKLSVKSVDFCGPFAVVKTRPGFANAVAYDIDDRGDELILGTIAGDDTILVIPREHATQEMLYKFLYSASE